MQPSFNKNKIKKSSKKPDFSLNQNQVVPSSQKISAGQTKRFSQNNVVSAQRLFSSQIKIQEMKSGIIVKQKQILNKQSPSTFRKAKVHNPKVAKQRKIKELLKQKITELSLIKEASSQQSFSNQSKTQTNQSLSSFDENQSNQFFTESNQSNESLQQSANPNSKKSKAKQQQLDKTMAKYNKKVNKQAQKNSQLNGPINENKINKKIQQTNIDYLSKKYSFQQLSQIREKGQISNKDYAKAVQIKKLVQKNLKQQKFNECLKLFQSKVDVILKNYIMIKNQMEAQIKNNQVQIKNFNKISSSKVVYSQITDKNEKLKRSQKCKIEIQLIKKQSQNQIKKQFLQILQSQIDIFQKDSSQLLQKIQQIKSSNEAFSQRQILKQLKDFMHASQREYKKLINPLKKRSQQALSLLDSTILKKYYQYLAVKYKKQKQDIQSYFMKRVEQIGIEIFKKDNKMTKQIFQMIRATVQKEISMKLQNTKYIFMENILLTKMIRQDGLLSQGKIFLKALIIVNQQNSELTLKQNNEMLMLRQFKFYNKNFQKLLKRAGKFDQLLQFYERKKQKANILAQQKRSKNISNRLQQILYKIKLTSNIIKFVYQDQKSSNIKSNIILKSRYLETEKSNCLEICNSKIKRYKILSQKVNRLLINLKSEQVAEEKPYLNLIPEQKVVYIETNSVYPAQKQQFWINRFGQQNSTNIIKTHLGKKQINTFSQKSILKSFTKDTSFKQCFIKSEINYKKSQQIYKQCEIENKINENLIQAVKSSIEQVNLQGKQQSNQRISRLCDLILNEEQVLKNNQKKVEEEQYIPYNQRPFSQIISYPKLVHYANKSSLQYSNQYKKKIEQSYVPSSIQIPNMKTQNYNVSTPFQKLSNAEIEKICHQFSKNFLSNPSIYRQLGEKQFYFLMSPQYRKYFLDKKQKDEKLKENILKQIRNNMALPKYYRQNSPNPVSEMTYKDPYFQQKIQEYQCKIVQNQNYIDNQQPVLSYKDALNHQSSSNTKFKLLQKRIQELEKKRIFQYNLDRNNEQNNIDISQMQMYQEVFL